MCSGNDLVTEITVNFAFLCFYSQYFKKNQVFNMLITFMLHSFALPFKNNCCFDQIADFFIMYVLPAGESGAYSLSLFPDQVAYGTGRYRVKKQIYTGKGTLELSAKPIQLHTSYKQILNNPNNIYF